MKFADDTVVIGCIRNNVERTYTGEIGNLIQWCQDNNLLLNVRKTKEVIVDFRRGQQRNYTPRRINGTVVERVCAVSSTWECTFPRI